MAAREVLLDSALAMAARGCHVFPCAAGGKQPALRGNWQQHATTDPARIEAWWAGRAYNIGISCGPSGLVVVDLDVPKADPDGEGGIGSLARLAARAGQPPPWATFSVGNCFTGIADPRGLAQIAETLSQGAAIGRLGQACDRWIYTACLCFGLDLGDQQASGFRYEYSVYQAEYSRNLIFASGARMDRVFGTVADRTRSRLDVPALRTLFGVKPRPAGTDEPSLKLAVVIERPKYDLTMLKVHFGLLTLKGYTKGERVLRFEAVVHNAKTLKTGRALGKFPDIVSRLADMAGRFCTMLDCLDTGFIPDGLLDDLPLPVRAGAVRTGGIDLNKPRIRAVLAAAAAPAPAPGGFTVADFTARVRSMTGQESYTVRQAAYDLRQLRGKSLALKPGRSRRYQIPDDAARVIVGLLTLRDHVIAPILAGVRSPRMGRKPATWTAIDRDYETLRISMQALFSDLGIKTPSAAA